MLGLGIEENTGRISFRSQRHSLRKTPAPGPMHIQQRVLHTNAPFTAPMSPIELTIHMVLQWHTIWLRDDDICKYKYNRVCIRREGAVCRGGACLYRFVRLDASREEGSEALMVGIQRSAV